MKKGSRNGVEVAFRKNDNGRVDMMILVHDIKPVLTKECDRYWLCSVDKIAAGVRPRMEGKRYSTKIIVKAWCPITKTVRQKHMSQVLLDRIRKRSPMIV